MITWICDRIELSEYNETLWTPEHSDTVIEYLSELRCAWAFQFFQGPRPDSNPFPLSARPG